MTEHELKAIDDVRQVYCSSDTDSVFLDYVLARLRQSRPAEEPAAEDGPRWADKIGRVVRVKATGETAEVAGVSPNGKPRLSFPGAIGCVEYRADEVEPWPRVGDRVILTDGVTDDHYEVVLVRGDKCKLEWDGTLQDGWFNITSLAPAPPKPDGPTDTEMFDWLESHEADLERGSGGWSIYLRGTGWLCRSIADPRQAMRIAMGAKP